MVKKHGEYTRGNPDKRAVDIFLIRKGDSGDTQLDAAHLNHPRGAIQLDGTGSIKQIEFTPGRHIPVPSHHERRRYLRHLLQEGPEDRYALRRIDRVSSKHDHVGTLRSYRAR